MITTRLARRIGLDGNPLRRRTDQAATALTLALLAVDQAVQVPREPV